MLNGLPAYCSISTDRIHALGENRAHGTFKATSLKGSPNLGTSYLSGVEHGNLETVKTLVAHQWKKSQLLQSSGILDRGAALTIGATIPHRSSSALITPLDSSMVTKRLPWRVHILSEIIFGGSPSTYAPAPLSDRSGKIRSVIATSPSFPNSSTDDRSRIMCI